MTTIQKHSEKRYRVRTKLKLKNRNNHKRIYLHITNRHLNAQLIDDVMGVTLVGVSTLGNAPTKNHSNKESAKALAGEFVKKLNEKKQDLSASYVFDRGSKIYHGKVAAFVEELRAQGVKV